MACSYKSPALRRFTRSCWLSTCLVVVCAVAAAMPIRFWHLKGFVVYPLAVLPALPIVWLLAEMGKFLAVEKDEFQRNLFVQCLLGGTGGTLAFTTAWGYLEAFAHAPHLDSMWIYPIFWLCVLITMPVVIWRYR